MLNVIRKVTLADIEDGSIVIGDQIAIPLEGLGVFTATAEMVTDDSIWFLFDDIVVRKKMNDINTNNGGFKCSQLYKWLQETLLPKFPEELRNQIQELTIPTLGQIVGQRFEGCDRFELEKSRQFSAMKEKKHRIAFFNNRPMKYWLQNPTTTDWFRTYFAIINSEGFAGDYESAIYPSGVRPIFRLIKEKKVPYRNNRFKEPTVEDELAYYSKGVFDSYIRAGFTEEQAFRVVHDLSVAILGGTR